MAHKILIAGCGDVGGCLGSELVAAGHDVWGLRRDCTKLPEGIQPVMADLTNPSTLRDLPRGLDFVFFAAAAGSRDEERYRQVYVEGLRHVLDALTAANENPSRVFFTSSTSVYGQQSGEWVDEDSSTNPPGFSGAILLEAEQLLSSSPFAATVVRFGGIYGPGRTYLIRGVREGSLEQKTNPRAFTNRIHRDDCAGVLAHLMNVDEPAEVYVAVDHDPAPYNEVLCWIADQLGMPEPGVGSEGPDAMRSPTNKRCSNQRLTQAGYAFRYPGYRDGYGELIRSERE